MCYLLHNPDGVYNRYALVDTSTLRWSWWCSTIAEAFTAGYTYPIVPDRSIDMPKLYSFLTSSSTRITASTHPELLI